MVGVSVHGAPPFHREVVRVGVKCVHGALKDQLHRHHLTNLS